MKKAPNIRFKDFTDAWEQLSFGDLTIELNEYETLKSGLPLLTSSRTGLMFQNEFRENASTDNNSTIFSVVPFGKCTYRHMSDDDIFHFNINTIVDKGLVSKEYPVFDSTEGTNLEFLILHLNSNTEFTKFCAQRKLGGTRTRLYYKKLCEYKLFLPNKEEQDKIASLLSALEKYIRLHQRKLEKLKLMKEAMLDKMFPKEGAKVPEIRFKGFNDEWVSCSIGECFSERSERSAIGELLSVTINSGVIKASELNKHDSSSEDKSNYKCVKKDDIAYNSMRMWQGASGHSSYDGIVSPAYTVIVPKEGVNSVFFAYMFKKPEIVWKFEINSQGLTKDTWNLKYPALSSIMIMKPCHEEQLKIAESLLNIDHAILNHQHKLEKLKQFKESMLDKMFI